MNKLPIKIITTGLLAGFITGCTSPAYDYRKEAVTTEITIPLNKTVKAGNTGLSISFDKIKSDSRCPINARCVWSGVAVVAATVKNSKGESKALSLGTVNFEKINNAEEAFGKRIKLIELLPKPIAGQAGKPELNPPSIKVKID